MANNLHNKKPASGGNGHKKSKLNNNIAQPHSSQQNYQQSGEKTWTTFHPTSRHVVQAGHAQRSTKYADLNEHLLKDVRSYLSAWLPGGKYMGREYVALNPTRLDRHLGSFRINTKTGQWADFATPERGRDLISLYAYLKGIKPSEALTELMSLS